MSSGQTGHITGQMGRVPGTDGTHTRGCPAKILYVYCFFVKRGFWSMKSQETCDKQTPKKSPKRSLLRGHRKKGTEKQPESLAFGFRWPGKASRPISVNFLSDTSIWWIWKLFSPCDEAMRRSWKLFLPSQRINLSHFWKRAGYHYAGSELPQGPFSENNLFALKVGLRWVFVNGLKWVQKWVFGYKNGSKVGRNPLFTHFKPILGFSQKPTFQPV